MPRRNPNMGRSTKPSEVSRVRTASGAKPFKTDRPATAAAGADNQQTASSAVAVRRLHGPPEPAHRPGPRVALSEDPSHFRARGSC
jgi:hypothetical protein